MAITKIFLTGSSGLLGSSILSQLNKAGEFSIKTLGFNDILKASDSELSNYLSDIDWTIHCAAQTNVEICEANEKECYVSNCTLTKKILTCSNISSRMLFISSTGVYGNHKNTPYNENDEVFPTTVHHKSKKISEDMVLSHSNRNIVVRTGWLFGNLSKDDFVSKIINHAKTNPKKIQSNNQQLGCPTNSNELATKCIELINKGGFGIFNIVNMGAASRYDYVKTIINELNYEIEVLPVNSSFFKRLAHVSDNEMAISIRLNEFGIEQLPEWQKSLSKFIKKND